MNRNSFFPLIIMILLWVILSEVFSAMTLAFGLVLSAFSLYYCRKYLPLGSITGVNYFKLAMYPVFLIGQIYLAGFQAIKMILIGAKADIVDVKTELTNDLLRVLLANSISLTPGSVSLDLKGETITVLWLRDKKSGDEDLGNAGDLIKGKLENKLLKSQRV